MFLQGLWPRRDLRGRWGPLACGNERAVPGHMLGLAQQADVPKLAPGKGALAPVPAPANIVRQARGGENIKMEGRWIWVRD